MIMRWIFAVVFWVAWFGSVFTPVRGQTTFNNLAVRTNLIVRGEQFTNLVMSPRMYGAVGDGVTDDTVAIQDMFDNAPAGATIHFAPGTYSVTNGVMIRRHNLTVTGSGATIRADADLAYGTLLGIANATNVTVRGLVLDVNENFDNGLTVIGNTSEFSGYLSALVGENYCSGIFIEGVAVYRARFDINLVEGLNFAGPPSFTVGELVRLNSNEKYLTATVLTNDIVNNRAVVRYLADRFPVSLSVEGITSGYVDTIIGRTSIPIESPNGTTYNSLQGAFGGKGFSLQYGTRGVIASGCYTFDCDTGLTIESRTLFNGENSGTVVADSVFRNSGRTGIWILCAGTPQGSASYTGAIISGCRIQNWGHTFGRFGAITADRASFIKVTDVLATQDPGYVPLAPAVAWVGSAANCEVDMTVEIQESGGIVDFRTHPPWGPAPGVFTGGCTNNDFSFKFAVNSVAPTISWVNSAGSFAVTNYAVAWDASSAMALGKSNIKLVASGWDNEAWLNRTTSTVQYNVTDQSSNSVVAIGQASQQVTFDPTFRITFNGNGPLLARNAIKFNDVVEANTLYKWGNNQGEIGWDHVNSYGYLRPRSGTFRIQNTSGAEVALIRANGFGPASANWDGKHLTFGSRELWFNGGTLYSKVGAPSSATDGNYVVPVRIGTVALVGGTATVLDAATSGTDIILLTSQVDGGTPGWVRVSGRVNATSFTITSSSGTDTSTIGYFIWKP
jgi:hypothetical protein